MKAAANTASLQSPRDSYRLILAVLIPLTALALQWLFRAALQPYVWFFFFPAVFFSSWVGGLRGGLAATILSTGLAWYFFIPPQFSFALERPMDLVSIGMFVGMGVLFSLFHDRLHKANKQVAEALAAVRSLNEELAESRQTLGDAIDAIPDAFVVYDAAGKLLHYNRRFHENLTAATPDVLVPGVTHETIERAWAERGLIPSAAGHVDEWLWIRNEARKSGAYSESALEAGNRFYMIQERRTIQGGIVGIYTDITERRRDEEAKARLAAVVENTDDAVIATDSDGLITSWNRSAERLFGYGAEEVTGRPVSILIPGEHASEESQVMTRVLRGEGVNHYETRRLRKDGSLISVSLTVSPIRDTSGTITGASKIARDITRQKTLEQQLLRQNAELQAQYRRVQEVNRLKSEYLANMSHELRTPLNAIIGFSELIHDGKAGLVNDEQKEFLNYILTSSQHLLRLINDVLDLAKVEAGKMEFHAEPVNLAALIGEVSDVLRAMLAEKRITLETQVDAALAGVTADPGKLKQALYNYLSNAIKFTPEGGRVAIRALPSGPECYRIEVEDTGVGIREEDMPRLFGEFQQLDAGAAKKYQGTGLGLALTRRIVEAHGGTVGASSRLGTGSTFYLELPRHLPGAFATPISAPGVAAPADGPLLLLIEDNPDDRAWFARVLSEAGYRVEAASDGTQAIAKCRERAYDAVILDILLPDVSGWDVMKALQNEGPNGATPVIAVSVLSEAPKWRGALEAFLTKPVSSEDLLKSLARAGVAPGADRRILVVDDDPGALKLAENLLRDAGYRVITASDGAQGLALFRDQRPDAVVLDLLMPGMTGFEFLEHVNASASAPQPPVIVWTVKDLTADEQRRLQVQARAMVAKSDPDGLRPLLQMLNRLVPVRHDVLAGQGREG